MISQHRRIQESEVHFTSQIRKLRKITMCCFAVNNDQISGIQSVPLKNNHAANLKVKDIG